MNRPQDGSTTAESWGWSEKWEAPKSPVRLVPPLDEEIDFSEVLTGEDLSPETCAASRYAKQGWPIFPCRNKVPLTPNGFHDAVITSAWETKDQIAIACGAAGLVVLDVDPAHGGEESLAKLIAEHGPLPETARVLTGGGGLHYYFRGSAKSTTDLHGMRGIDLRSVGGYVVAPPSLHASGNRYAWDAGAHLDDVPIAHAPAWLLGPKSQRLTRKIRNGTRNNELTRIAGGMRGIGKSAEEIRAELERVNREECEAPLPTEEIQKIAASVSRYAPEPSLPTPKPMTPVEVIAQWRTEGPLIHESTGLGELDERTGGGPVYGTRWYVLGSPDAGKTAFLVRLADDWAEKGIAVGYLAVDEEPSDITTRLAQRRGYARYDCEERDPDILDGIAERLSAVFMYDASWTIEAAALDLSKRGSKCALFVDSIQTCECDLERGAEEHRPRSIREAVGARTKALRQVATKHKLIAMAASEMNRSGYRSRKDAEDVNDLATAKESGAIEYSGRVLLALRSVPADVAEDMVECRIAKNKHGPCGAVPIYFKLDRQRMDLTECAAPQAPAGEGRKGPRDEDLIALQKLVLVEPGLGTTKLRQRAKNAGLGGHDVVGALVTAALDAGLIEDRAVPRGKVVDHHYYPVSHLPEQET